MQQVLVIQKLHITVYVANNTSALSAILFSIKQTKFREL